MSDCKHGKPLNMWCEQCAEETDESDELQSMVDKYKAYKLQLMQSMNLYDDLRLLKDKLMSENEELRRKKTQRGARLQIMWERLQKLHENIRSEDSTLDADDYREMYNWFDEDGVPK